MNPAALQVLFDADYWIDKPNKNLRSYIHVDRNTTIEQLKIFYSFTTSHLTLKSYGTRQ